MPSRSTLHDQAEQALALLRLRAGVAAATLHRRRLGAVRFIGVTGSAGKTTTKELIAAALGSELRGRKSPGEGNGMAVVAKTVLRTAKRDDFCVVEVAAGARPGLVAETARMIRPNIAVVTNVGSEHHTAFRTRERTAAEKRALVDAVMDDGVAVLNADDPYVIAMAEGFSGQVITFGCSPGATLRAEEVQSKWPEPLSFTLHTRERSLPVRTRLYGKHWVSSMLAALGVAAAMDVPTERAVDALATVGPVPSRMRPIYRNGFTFIQDNVKAPFWAVGAALEFLADARALRKVAVIGTISDYGGSATPKYVKVARRALDVADEVVFVGPNARHALKAGKDSRPGALLTFATVQEAGEYLRASLREGDLVLLKGSERADHLNRLLYACETS
jgi:UDP-N-acetylmuramoyl-tripeptide--D-alanyl-D-alanine ligase